MTTVDSQIVDQVRRFVGGHVDAPDLADGTDLFATGLASSLFAVQIVMWLEQTFGVTVTGPEMDITNFRSITAIADFVAARHPAPTG